MMDDHAREHEILEQRLAIAREEGRREGWDAAIAAVAVWMRRPGFDVNVTTARLLKQDAVPYAPAVPP